MKLDHRIRDGYCTPLTDAEPGCVPQRSHEQLRYERRRSWAALVPVSAVVQTHVAGAVWVSAGTVNVEDVRFDVECHCATRRAWRKAPLPVRNDAAVERTHQRICLEIRGIEYRRQSAVPRMILVTP